MWNTGTISVPEGNGKYTVVKYKVKHFDEPSTWGYEKAEPARSGFSRTAWKCTALSEER